MFGSLVPENVLAHDLSKALLLLRGVRAAPTSPILRRTLAPPPRSVLSQPPLHPDLPDDDDGDSSSCCRRREIDHSLKPPSCLPVAYNRHCCEESIGFAID
jgi:hypothetical protein